MNNSLTPTTYTSVYRDAIFGIISAHKTERLLIVLPDDDALFCELSGHYPKLRVTRLTGDKLVASVVNIEPKHIGIVAHTLEYMSKQSAGTVISRLRDLYCKIFYAIVPVGSEWTGLQTHWEPSELIAYGLRRIKVHPLNGKSLQIYNYDWYNYKTTPDWLNPKHWANPHRWDKMRW